jgi:hypothetical protein
MAAQNIDGTAEGSGVYNTKVPGYEDPADIQAALKLFLYGSATFDPTASGAINNLPNPSIARYIKVMQDEIDALTAAGIGSSYGTEPSTPQTGQIWMSSSAAVDFVPAAAVSIYQATAPTLGLTNGLLWIDSSGSTPILKVYDSGTSTWKVVG